MQHMTKKKKSKFTEEKVDEQKLDENKLEQASDNIETKESVLESEVEEELDEFELRLRRLGKL